MEIQEQGELLLHRQLASEEFKIGRERAIDLVGEILREWSFREQSLTGRMPLQAVEGRVKSPDSIVEKLKKKGYDLTLEGAEKLHDLSGIRAICGYLDDVYRLRKYLLSYSGIHVLSQKDYIAIPKKSGYQSLHMLLGSECGVVELQIRTVTMDYWSSLEHPAIYKKGRNADEKMGRELSRYAGFLRKVDGILVAMRIEQENQALVGK